MAPKRTRAFVVTNWNLNTAEIFEANKRQIRFVAFGEETCPTTGTRHHQVFVYYHNLKSTTTLTLNKIGKEWGAIHCRVAPMYGNFVQNEAYCSKEGTYTKLGDEPKQGARGDLVETCTLLRNGTISADFVAQEDPVAYHMYGRTLIHAETMFLRTRFRTEMTQCKWYWGATGVGKSHKAFAGYSNETHYVKDLETKWWDGYKQQDTVILNEFRGQLTFSFLLSLIDKWPLTVCVRNKESIPFTSKLVIITSSVHPKDIYKNVLTSDESLAQLERRCKIKELVRVFV